MCRRNRIGGTFVSSLAKDASSYPLSQAVSTLELARRPGRSEGGRRPCAEAPTLPARWTLGCTTHHDRRPAATMALRIHATPCIVKNDDVSVHLSRNDGDAPCEDCLKHCSRVPAELVNPHRAMKPRCLGQLPRCSSLSIRPVVDGACRHRELRLAASRTGLPRDRAPEDPQAHRDGSSWTCSRMTAGTVMVSRTCSSIRWPLATRCSKPSSMG